MEKMNEKLSDIVMTPNQYESIIASLQLEAINFDGDERFKTIAKLIDRLAYDIPICKQEKIKDGYCIGELIIVGHLNTKGDIILHNSNKDVSTIDVEYPKLYLPGFYTHPIMGGRNVKNATRFLERVNSTNVIDEVKTDDWTIGYVDSGKVTYWQQYGE